MIEILKKSLVLSFYELKAKNHNTYLGFLWYFLQPLMMFVVLYYVKVNVIETHIENFVPYLFVGVIMIHFFISSTTSMSDAVVKNYELLNSRKIKVDVFIFSKFFVSLWRHLFEALMVVIILSFLGYYHSIFYLLVLPLYGVFVFGIGKILCVLSTKVFDVTYVWSYFCQILWFILPIYYLANTENILIKYNPIYYFLELGRGLTYEISRISENLILIGLIISVVSILIGNIIFNSQKETISERIK